MAGTPPRRSATHARRRFATGSAVRTRRFRLGALVASTILAVPVVVTTTGTAASGGRGGRAPGPPTQVTAQAGNGQATVSFTAPEDEGSSRITSYTVYAVIPSVGGSTVTATGKTSPITVTGLTNNAIWAFTVAATNRTGQGPTGSAENVAIPTSVPQLAPDPPTDVTLIGGDGQVTVSYRAPVRRVVDFELYGYIATAINLTNPADGAESQQGGYPDGQPVPITITGLTNGDQYAVSVVTENQPGPSWTGGLATPTSAPSALSNPVTPAGPPHAPQNVTATAGDSEAVVSFDPPHDDGGSPIVDYIVTSEDETDPARSGQTAFGPASPLTVPELVNGHTYTFTVRARSEAGDSPESLPSPPVTLSVGPGNPPGPAHNVRARPGDGRATLSFTAPVDEGSSPITSYTLYAENHLGGTPTRVQGFGEVSPIIILGLTNYEYWTISIAAVNEAGEGPAVPAENGVVPTGEPRLVPDPPTNVTATPGDGQAIVSYEPPVRRVVGFEITGYTATAVNLSHPPAGGQYNIGFPGDPITISGLTNGDVYAFTVVTLSQTPDGTEPYVAASSAPSELSDHVVPAGPPGAPAIGKAAPGDGEAKVSFDPPQDDGGAPIIDYVVTAEDETDLRPGGESAARPESPITVDSLTDGHTYTFRVRARNEAGVGPPSEPSEPVVPNGRPDSAPGAPTDVRAEAGDGEATVSWDPPEKTGGTPILGYSVTAIDRKEPGRGGQSVATSTTSATVKNLTGGDRYVFVVTATNAVGSGPVSDPSDAVVPKGPDREEEPERDEPRRQDDEPRQDEEPNREEEPNPDEETPETTAARGISRPRVFGLDNLAGGPRRVASSRGTSW